MAGSYRPKHILRSIGAVFAGILVNVVPAIATDIALAAVGFFPSLSKPEVFTSPLLLVATAYRSICGIAGGYLTARLAPGSPMIHAMVLGALGLAAATAGAITMWGVGPAWYPLALVVLAIPCAWAGGKLRAIELRRGAHQAQVVVPPN